jgi:hypothetical protein
MSAWAATQLMVSATNPIFFEPPACSGLTFSNSFARHQHSTVEIVEPDKGFALKPGLVSMMGARAI